MQTRLPVFITGMARSGSNLIARMMGAHPEIAIAVDPFFYLFKIVRDALIEKVAVDLPQAKKIAGMAIQDYYFAGQIPVMDRILSSDLDLPVTLTPEDRERIVERARYDCADIVPLLDHLRGETAKEWIESGLEIVARARAAKTKKWVGCKEVWIIELFPALARSFPQSRFVVIHRDPRAVIASMRKMAESDPTQQGHFLSYLRHFRKYAALGLFFQKLEIFAERLFILKYEDLVQDPRRVGQQVCDFLQVPFAQEMLDSEEFIDHSSGQNWQANTSYEIASGIFSSSLTRWEKVLSPELMHLIHYCCEPELKYLGYPLPPGTLRDITTEDVTLLLRLNSEPCSWRSDRENPIIDMGGEMLRRALLKGRQPVTDPDLIRESFLFTEVYECLWQAMNS